MMLLLQWVRMVISNKFQFCEVWELHWFINST